MRKTNSFRIRHKQSAAILEPTAGPCPNLSSAKLNAAGVRPTWAQQSVLRGTLSHWRPTYKKKIDHSVRNYVTAGDLGKERLGGSGKPGQGSADPLKFRAEVRNCIWCLFLCCVWYQVHLSFASPVPSPCIAFFNQHDFTGWGENQRIVLHDRPKTGFLIL